MVTTLSLSLPVLASFPLCDITEEDLTSNPQFCGLLATLTQHLDRTGLTVPLKTELDKVNQTCQDKPSRMIIAHSCCICLLSLSFIQAILK